MFLELPWSSGATRSFAGSRQRSETVSEKVIVFDTTLRDGEQAAGVCFSARDKVEIARRLADMRVDVIEAGFPAASAVEA